MVNCLMHGEGGDGGDLDGVLKNDEAKCLEKGRVRTFHIHKSAHSLLFVFLCTNL